MTSPNANAQLLPTMPIDRHRPVLFCLPHAGGGTSLFYRWRRYLPEWLQLAPLRLPGREDRMRDRPYNQMSMLIRDATKSIQYLGAEHFALLGHSMGSHVAFEITRQLAEQGASSPVSLIVAGASAPQLVTIKNPLHELPDDQFISAIRDRYDGLPAAVLDDERLLQLVMPTLRADMRMVETYKFTPGSNLSCDMLALGGLDDPGANFERLMAWREMTTGTFTMRQFPGGHFFLHPEARKNAATSERPPTIQCVVEHLAEQFHEVA